MTRRIEVRRSGIHGRGVFAATDLAASLRVIEYRGRRISHDEADACYDGTLDSGHTFLFTLNDHWIVDANQGGNSARWINHSCDPNCEAVIHVDRNGDEARDRVFIETLRPVRAGEELTYNYGIVLDVPHTARLKRIWACRCGARNCTGTMLQPRRRRAA
ncbi:MAG: SET domain-containing protein-lysine N-methyltransferase [Xanthomonadales bacterium]|nr:SET domain-containing protein-lysine N-methyltransferase [Xanthomonadales bacterium]